MDVPCEAKLVLELGVRGLAIAPKDKVADSAVMRYVRAIPGCTLAGCTPCREVFGLI